jgi:two-component system sensor histidine kinase QseC
MKLTQRLSLKLRLTLLFLVLSLTAWFAASVVAWQQTSHKLDKLFDTQQMLFAKRLLTMDLDEIHAPQRMREIPKKARHGRLDDDALAFAIYSPTEECC